MVNYKKAIKNFIEDIPDSALQAFPDNEQTLHDDVNFRLDMQGLTTATHDQPQCYNLQVQVNISTLKGLAPNTVAGPVLVPTVESWTPDDIRTALLNKIIKFK